MVMLWTVERAWSGGTRPAKSASGGKQSRVNAQAARHALGTRAAARLRHVPPCSGMLSMLLFTDNHCGYKDGDRVLGHDSFRAFEECFQLAHEHNVDFLLNGGDVFHDHRPSRRTQFRYVPSLSDCSPDCW